jgi:hypothetical protein
VPLGEELPIFCERCGYSLNGLPQIRCGACEVLHFACPECNHHQPINTLRPAAQRIIGRMRAIGLTLIMLVKINFFGWCLFAWGALGTEISYRYDYRGGNFPRALVPVEYQTEIALAVFCFALGFGLVGRMLLLRRRSGAYVGLCIAALVVLALTTGAYLRQLDVSTASPPPWGGGFVMFCLTAFVGVCVGSTIVWGIWLALVHAFLPKRAANALLEWQRAMSAPRGVPSRVDAATSVTA